MNIAHYRYLRLLLERFNHYVIDIAIELSIHAHIFPIPQCYERSTAIEFV